jgi:cell division protein FtsN
MAQSSAETGLELVLDNRRLIVAFVLLVLVCGTFFILGFIEGKRQGSEALARNTPSQAVPESVSDQQRNEGTRPIPPKAPETPAARESGAPLQWYGNVGKSEPPAAKIAPPPPPKPAVKAGAEETGTATSAAASAAGPLNYTVQIGAFHLREDAEKRGDLLKAKGYPYVIEPPAKAGDYYLVKVGQYKTRAEAQATKLRLQKDGFTTFIKTF